MKIVLAKQTSQQQVSSAELQQLAERAEAQLLVPPKDAAIQHNGRASVYIDHEHEPAILAKTYCRGGLVARLSRHTYFGFPDTATRMVRELQLLDKLHAQGLAVPQPVAAIIRRCGPCYRGQLLSHYIADSHTLADELRANQVADSTWHAVGKTLGQFHAAGVYHADLNASNILLDAQNKVYLIDFDKGEVRAGSRWQAANLARLERSINKILSTAGYSGKSTAGWQSLLEAYKNANTA